MADENLYDEQIDRELLVGGIFLAAKAGRTALTISEFIQMRLASGVASSAIQAELLNDLNNGGRMFAELRRSIKATAKGSITRTRDIGYFSELGVDRDYRWSAILVSTCSSCKELHGQVKSWEEWEAGGLPRLRETKCRENCHCVLIPVEFTELQPIKREKRK